MAGWEFVAPTRALASNLEDLMQHQVYRPNGVADDDHSEGCIVPDRPRGDVR